MRTGCTCLFVSAVILAAPTWAWADAATDTAIDKGLDLREAGRDAEALEIFRQAYLQSKEPRALAQIALAEQALGQWVEAEAHLQQALATRDAWIDARRTPLEGALAAIQKRLAKLTVVIPEVEGAEIRINGKVVGRSPLAKPISVAAGSVVVQVEAEGYFPMSRSRELAPESVAQESFTLVSRPPTEAVAATPSVPAPTPVTTAPDAAAEADLTSSGGPNLTVPAVVATGGAVAALGTGVAFLLIRNDNIDAYNDDAQCVFGNLSRQERCGDKLNAADDAEVIAIIGFAGAGVLAATAVTFFVFDGSGDETAAFGPGPGDVGLSWAARF